MNYRHVYHAGNHADVLKHIVMLRALLHLRKKDKPFLFLDAHAGTGLYALWGDEALKTLEWQDGVGRFYDPSGHAVLLEPDCEVLIEPWRQAIASVNAAGQPLSHYPGSPGFALRILRRSDRLLLNELHPEDHGKLAGFIGGDKRVTVSDGDAAVVVKAHLPPPERRGFILIDPPYEREDEARRAVRMLRDGHRRFATGAYALWYPVTGDGLSDLIAQEVLALALPKTLKAELLVRRAVKDGGLAGSGLILVNPPWPIADELAVLGPALLERLRQTEGAQWSLNWLTDQG
ncbi:23S rRNA (adenine(2030)-N(6))-methyltransferase RlmJ [Taklimakanibacter lacteus]|uniref:23S rRNA (adenine(2030)-N(6))-methyltransferase RlmJ n=1 Tax=Taklimakanibacter lacteus TaxID=2268456 RepID=UPI0013C41558